MEQEIYHVSNASKYLGVSSATLRSWKRQGRGPAYFRAGKLLRYRRADLETCPLHEEFDAAAERIIAR